MKEQVLTSIRSAFAPAANEKSEQQAALRHLDEALAHWKPGTLKDDGKRGGSEKGFRK